MRRLLPGQAALQALDCALSDHLRSAQISSGGQKLGQNFAIVSRTVKDLVAGSGISSPTAESTLKGVPREWRLYAVQRETPHELPVFMCCWSAPPNSPRRFITRDAHADIRYRRD